METWVNFQQSKQFVLILTEKSSLNPSSRKLSNRWRPLQKTTTDQKANLWSPVPMDTSTKQLLNVRLRVHCRRGGGWKDSKRQGIQEFAVRLSPSDGEATTIALLTCLTNCELNEDNKKHIKVDMVKSMKPQLYTKNYRQLENAEWKKWSSPGNSTPIGHSMSNGQP